MEEENKRKSKLRKVKAIIVQYMRLLEKGLMMIEDMVEHHEVKLEKVNLKSFVSNVG